ncbi:hypothetical protein GCM10028799_39270 [Kribbella italica]
MLERLIVDVYFAAGSQIEADHQQVLRHLGIPFDTEQRMPNGDINNPSPDARARGQMPRRKLFGVMSLKRESAQYQLVSWGAQRPGSR